MNYIEEVEEILEEALTQGILLTPTQKYGASVTKEGVNFYLNYGNNRWLVLRYSGKTKFIPATPVVPRMSPLELIPIPEKPIEIPEIKTIVVPEESPIINDSVGWLDLMKEWFRQTIITDIVTQLKGGGAMTDPKTTITALVTGIVGVLSFFGIVIPAEWLPVIILIGSTLIGIFAGDSKKKTTP